MPNRNQYASLRVRKAQVSTTTWQQRHGYPPARAQMQSAAARVADPSFSLVAWFLWCWTISYSYALQQSCQIVPKNQHFPHLDPCKMGMLYCTILQPCCSAAAPPPPALHPAHLATHRPTAGGAPAGGGARFSLFYTSAGKVVQLEWAHRINYEFNCFCNEELLFLPRVEARIWVLKLMSNTLFLT